MRSRRFPARSWVFWLWALALGSVGMGLSGMGGIRAARAEANAPDRGPIPVRGSDPSWGDAAARVTIVEFANLLCTHCNNVTATLDELRQDYGASQIRIVYKHFPPNGGDGYEAAAVGAAIRKVAGNDAFWKYQAQAFTALASGDGMDLARTLGLDVPAIEKRIAAGAPKKKVNADIALAKKLGVEATPTFFINGVFVAGARKKSELAKVIDAELARAAQAVADGTPADRVSVEMTKKNVADKAGRPELQRFAVPIGTSPVLGRADALVTFVVFSDFQCPFCAKLWPTIAALRGKYGEHLRVVLKHNPLPFHARADEAAALALEANRRRGASAFWQAVPKLYAAHKNLDDAALESIARDVHLSPAAALRAIARGDHGDAIDEDRLLAAELGATATPCSFINGRRLCGAFDQQRFEALIDEEIATANELFAGGVAKRKIYDQLMKSALAPPPPKKKSVPPLDAATPTKGAKTAPVTIQIFSDFECPFCKRILPTLARIEKTYGRAVRIAYRHRPQLFHPDAMHAHEAAAEAFRQGGNRAFWQLYQRIFADPDALSDADLQSHFTALHLDAGELASAWQTERHRPRIDADIALAEARDVGGLPAFIINGYYLSGVQPFVAFKRLIDRALADAKAGRH